MDDINSIEQSFKDLQEYSDTQFHIVKTMEKEISILKAQNESLKLLISGNGSNDIGITNEQLICETQISLLKDRAVQKELNADEVRRFTQLFEVLEKIKKSSVNVDDVTIKQMSDQDLLKLVVSNDSGK